VVGAGVGLLVFVVVALVPAALAGGYDGAITEGGLFGSPPGSRVGRASILILGTALGTALVALLFAALGAVSGAALGALIGSKTRSRHGGVRGGDGGAVRGLD
jgi:hypothetical protein